MARPANLNGGAKEVFPRAVSNGLLDLRALRQEIEKAEAIAEDVSQSLPVRRKWRSYRDLLEEALDVRIELMQRSTESHERAISGRAMPTCRDYERCDPCVRVLHAMATERLAQKKIAVSVHGTGDDAA